LTISSFLLRVGFLGLPGIICFFLFRMLTSPRPTKSWEDALKIGVFALLSYMTYAAVFLAVREVFGLPLRMRFYTALFDEKEPLPLDEVTWACVASAVLAFVAAAAHNHKLVNKLGRKLGVTKRYGDEDVWAFLHNAPRDSQWAFVRDHKVHLTYYGWIDVFSDAEEERELILSEVDVFDEQSNHLYSTPTLYICRSKEDLTIEFPPQEEEPSQAIPARRVNAQESEHEQNTNG